MCVRGNFSYKLDVFWASLFFPTYVFYTPFSLGNNKKNEQSFYCCDAQGAKASIVHMLILLAFSPGACTIKLFTAVIVAVS